MQIKKIMSILFLFLFMSSINTLNVHAWKIVYDPTNHTENLANKLQLIENYKKQLEQIQHELSNLAKLDSSQLKESMGQLKSLVSTMQNLRDQTNAIGTDFRTAMQQLDQIRPDYSKWNGASGEDYANQADKVRNSIDKSIEQAIKTQGLVSSDEVNKTADELDRLSNAAQNAEGAVSVAQAAAQISALQVKQLVKLQAIMADSMRTQTLFFNKINDDEKMASKIKEDFLKNSGNYDDAKVTSQNSKIGEYKD